MVETNLELIKAAENGEIAKIEKLHAEGVNLNITDQHGRTALMLAAKKGHLEIVKFLVNNGADVNLQSQGGWTALSYASNGGHIRVAEFLENITISKLNRNQKLSSISNFLKILNMNISDDALKALILTIAIVDLGSAYMLYSYQQLLSVWAMAGLLLLMLISFLSLFFLNVFSLERSSSKIVLQIIAILSVILLIYSISYDWSIISRNAFINLGLPTLAALLSSIILSVFNIVINKKMSKIGFYLLFIIFASIMTGVAFFVMSSHASSYGAVDEAIYNYYSAYLTTHLQNPYTTSMEPIYLNYHITPVPTVNGSYDFYYGYPPLSFIPFLPLVPFWPVSAFAFKLFTIFVSSFAALIAYYKFRPNGYAILPLFVFMAFSYSSVAVPNTYLAVSIFLVLAFITMTKRRFISSGILMGAAISIHQTSWFAIPFFFIYCYNRFGKDAFFKQSASALAIFVILSLPFILTGTYISNIFGLLGRSNTFYGLNVADFLIGFFPVPNITLLILSVSVFSLSIILYYFYNRSLFLFLPLIPAFIFLLSWKGVINYSLPYMILFIVVASTADNKSFDDRLQDKRPMPIAIAGLTIMLIALIFYFHGQYAQSPAMIASPYSMNFSSTSNTGNAVIYSFEISIINNLDSNQTPLIFLFSSNPYGYYWAPTANVTLAPGRGGILTTYYNITTTNKTNLGIILIDKNAVNLTLVDLCKFKHC